MSKIYKTAECVLEIARSFFGVTEKDPKFSDILEVYNNHKPLARGYKIKKTDEWCAAFVSVCSILANTNTLTGTEVGVEPFVQIFKTKGIWMEDGHITPEPGDIIVYNWLDGSQPNDGRGQHIGIVESVNSKTITTIEGNKNEMVARRVIPVGWGYIRGYARPNYEKPFVRPRISGSEIEKRLVDHLVEMECSPEALEACKEAVASGIFYDGDKDGLLDNPRGFLRREELAMVLSRMGLFDNFLP